MSDKLTAADKKVLRLAIRESGERWRHVERNLGVKARAEEGAWDLPPATAARKQRAVTNRLAALAAAAGKLGIY